MEILAFSTKNSYMTFVDQYTHTDDAQSVHLQWKSLNDWLNNCCGRLRLWRALNGFSCFECDLRLIYFRTIRERSTEIVWIIVKPSTWQMQVVKPWRSDNFPQRHNFACVGVTRNAPGMPNMISGFFNFIQSEISLEYISFIRSTAYALDLNRNIIQLRIPTVWTSSHLCIMIYKNCYRH